MLNSDTLLILRFVVTASIFGNGFHLEFEVGKLADFYKIIWLDLL